MIKAWQGTGVEPASLKEVRMHIYIHTIYGEDIFNSILNRESNVYLICPSV